MPGMVLTSCRSDGDASLDGSCKTMDTLVAAHVSIHARQQRMHRGVARLRARGWQLLHPGVQIGRSVRIGRNCRLFLDPDARLIIGDGCVIDDAVTIAVYG